MDLLYARHSPLLTHHSRIPYIYIYIPEFSYSNSLLYNNKMCVCIFIYYRDCHPNAISCHSTDYYKKRRPTVEGTHSATNTAKKLICKTRITLQNITYTHTHSYSSTQLQQICVLTIIVRRDSISWRIPRPTTTHIYSDRLWYHKTRKL